jgi:hypothetical protein
MFLTTDVGNTGGLRDMERVEVKEGVRGGAVLRFFRSRVEVPRRLLSIEVSERGRSRCPLWRSDLELGWERLRKVGDLQS